MTLPELPSPTLLAIPGFIGFILLELFVRWLRGGVDYETRDSLASLTMGAGNVVEGFLVGGLKYTVLMFVYQFAPYKWGFSLGAFVLAYVLDDFRYYWYHRFAHERRWFWAAHIIHHSSQHYNLSTALRQTWTTTLSLAFVFAFPLALLGIHPIVLAFVSSLNAIYQFWIHTEAIRRLPWPIEAVFNTPSHHRVHHARNPRYLDANYAGTLIIWESTLWHLRARRRCGALPLRACEESGYLQSSTNCLSRMGRHGPRCTSPRDSSFRPHFLLGGAPRLEP